MDKQNQNQIKQENKLNSFQNFTHKALTLPQYQNILE